MGGINLDGSLQLKGGQRTEDSRLGRVIDFDERSRAHPVTRRSARAAAKRVTSRLHHIDQRLDQRNEGACTVFSLGHEAHATPAPVAGELPFAWLVHRYWDAQYLDSFAGGAYPGARPFYEGTSVLASLKVFQRLGFFKGYEWAFTFEQGAYAVSKKGPGCLGIWWMSGMEAPDAGGRIRAVGAKLGGHALQWVGNDLSGTKHWLDGDAILLNSWGREWGKDGMAVISFRELAGLLEDDGELAFPKHRTFRPRKLDLSVPKYWTPPKAA